MPAQTSPIHYTIIPVNPEAHLFQVTCTIRNPDKNGQIVWLPAWIPGSYMIRDFAKNIVTIEASSEGTPLSLQKLDKHTWKIQRSNATIRLTYLVYAWDLSVRTAHLDKTHAFFNGSSVFLAVKDQEETPCSIDIHRPEGEEYSKWRIATGLNRDKTELFRPGRYLAKNYDELIDCPVEMGTFSESSFTINNVPHHIIITGKHATDVKRLGNDVEKICRTHIAMFGELPKMERYIFMLTVTGDGYGGLEHRNSTALICSRKDLPHRNMSKPSEGYITLLGLFSHEYFHTWNVKQIKPKEFVPYQLQQESYTSLLWAFEGFTSYYDELALVRSGVITVDDYLVLIGKNITRVIKGTGRHKQTLEESSFEAWTKFYKQDENAPNAIVSYYVKGGLFAFCLDTQIRNLSDHSSSLDDLMKELWEKYGRKQVGVTTEDIIDIASSLAGKSLSDFFKQYISGTDELPLQENFRQFAIAYKTRAATSLDDAGGKSANDDSKESFFLGARFSNQSPGANIQIIYEGSDIQKAGFATGDTIIAINGIKVDRNNLFDILSTYLAGDELSVHAFRRDELFETRMTLTKAPQDICYLEVDKDAASGEDLRQQWLHQDTN